ncbi:hypothetical protein ACC754_44415, partial [Rhizobium johnstonii]
GFMFDTGAHMMNTVCLLSNSDFDSVSAYMNNHGRQVDIATAVSARLKNGAGVEHEAAAGDVRLLLPMAVVVGRPAFP